jgi:hypothetical protein
MASIRDHVNDDEPRGQYDNALLADISADENTASTTQDEDEERRRASRVKNAKRPKRKWTTRDKVPLATLMLLLLQLMTTSTPPLLPTSMKLQSCSSDYPKIWRLKGDATGSMCTHPAGSAKPHAIGVAQPLEKCKH